MARFLAYKGLKVFCARAVKSDLRLYKQTGDKPGVETTDNVHQVNCIGLVERSLTGSVTVTFNLRGDSNPHIPRCRAIAQFVRFPATDSVKVRVSEIAFAVAFVRKV